MSAKGIDETDALEGRIEELRAAETVALDDVVGVLVALPDETTVEHRVYVENLVARVPTTVEHLETVLDRTGMVFEDANAKAVRFGAFLALHAHYRQRRDLTAMERLHDEYGHLFSDRPTYDAAHAELLRLRDSPEDVTRAVAAFKDAVEEVPDNPWLHHALAETVVEAIEDDTLPEVDREEYRDRAREAVDRAVELRPGNGKYRVTRGRLLALEGEYDRARAEIERGIHLTDPDREDYALRTARFQRHLLSVEVRAEERRLGERIDAAEDRLEDLQRRSEEAVGDFRNAALQFLGFFTAVLAAVLVTVQVAVSYPPAAAGTLVLMVFGGLTASVAAFNLTLDGDAGRAEVAMVLAGVAVLFVGFVAALLV